MSGCVYYDCYTNVVILRMTSATPERFRCSSLGCDKLLNNYQKHSQVLPKDLLLVESRKYSIIMDEPY